MTLRAWPLWKVMAQAGMSKAPHVHSSHMPGEATESSQGDRDALNQQECLTFHCGPCVVALIWHLLVWEDESSSSSDLGTNLSYLSFESSPDALLILPHLTLYTSHSSLPLIPLSTEPRPFLSVSPSCTPLGRCCLSMHFFHSWNLSCTAMGFKIVVYLGQKDETLVRMKMPRPQLSLPSKELWVELALWALEHA